MSVRKLNMDCITIHGQLIFNIKKSYDFLNGYITLNLDHTC